MADPVPDALELLIGVTTRRLQQVPSRTSAARLASELVRLNDAVRDMARPMLTPFDQPADFAAVLRRHADV